MQVLHKFEDAMRHHPQQFAGDSTQRMHYAAAYLMRVSTTHTQLLSVTTSFFAYNSVSLHADTTCTVALAWQQCTLLLCASFASPHARMNPDLNTFYDCLFVSPLSV
jgi:hypothetical protein